MPAEKDEATAAGDREIVTTRLFDAPRQLVFEAWTDPKHVAQWWGPRGFTNTIHEMDNSIRQTASIARWVSEAVTTSD